MALGTTSRNNSLTEARARIRAFHRAPEADCLKRLLLEAEMSARSRANITVRAGELVTQIRATPVARFGVENFLHQFGLSTPEGVVLMCLAESLIRVPDTVTADKLISDKLASVDWGEHLGKSPSLLVNASTWALMLTGRLVDHSDALSSDVGGLMKRLLARLGEPVVRHAIGQGIRLLGKQFVMGRTIAEARQRGRDGGAGGAGGYRYSYDILGEAARTAAIAEHYAAAYSEAIGNLADDPAAGTADGPSISVKLSALHPRFEFSQADRVMRELVPRVVTLARAAREGGVAFTIDAEEADRLDLTLDVFETVSSDPELADWPGLGLAVQAYQKRAIYVLDWLDAFAQSRSRRFSVRLVKGAYWDAEIKRAQQGGFDDYPVFTRKAATDVSYLACARRLLASPKSFYPCFATHNAHSIASIIEMAGGPGDYEFQRLHGMGEALYDQLIGAGGRGIPCRVYAPVGGYEDLLPYLVRRLLENGANTSFVHHVVDPAIPVEALIADPVERTQTRGIQPHPHIPPPGDLYGAGRANAAGLDFSDAGHLALVGAAIKNFRPTHTAAPIVGGQEGANSGRPVADPADHRRSAGTVVEAEPQEIKDALARAHEAAPGWDAVPAVDRAATLDRLASLLEEDMPSLIALCAREAGKTLEDGLSEVREAVDFCRYYASRARAEFAEPETLSGPTGESNQISLHGRGVFACISPWNFPLAIFLGQVVAALAAGNAVVAKPAEQTPLIAATAVRLAHRAGVPVDTLHLLPGPGESVGAAIVADPRTSGVAFTGSHEAARAINQALAARPGPIAPLIAETGGQNVMIVDSSALPEQVVPDIIASAFRSAGQRCSALRVLFVQHDVADGVLNMLTGAMAELVIGDPGNLETDVGPIIDADARDRLVRHVERMEKQARVLFRTPLPEQVDHGTFFAPTLIAIDKLTRLTGEVFGPILHVVRFESGEIDTLAASINATGYGLTLGIHSRIDGTARQIHAQTRVGNTYVNRDMIGAVVGVQPFGGQGLSGTGPKAGGPRYLHRFAIEKTLTINTTAAGGDATLLAAGEEFDG